MSERMLIVKCIPASTVSQICEVEETTDSHIIFTNGLKFNKCTGRQMVVKDTYLAAWSLCGQQTLSDEAVHNIIAGHLASLNWYTLPTEVLNKIQGIINEIE